MIKVQWARLWELMVQKMRPRKQTTQVWKIRRLLKLQSMPVNPLVWRHLLHSCSLMHQLRFWFSQILNRFKPEWQATPRTLTMAVTKNRVRNTSKTSKRTTSPTTEILLGDAQDKELIKQAELEKMALSGTKKAWKKASKTCEYSRNNRVNIMSELGLGRMMTNKNKS